MQKIANLELHEIALGGPLGVFDLSCFILSSILPRTESIRALWPEKVTGPGQRTGQRTHNQGRIIPEEASAG